MKTILYTVILLFSIIGKSQTIDFQTTQKYITEKIANYSDAFDNKGTKVASVQLSEDGLVIFNYTNKKKPISFNLHDLKILHFENELYNCDCGIVMSDLKTISFWITNEKSYILKIDEKHAKPLFNAFVNLKKIIKDKPDIFAD